MIGGYIKNTSNCEGLPLGWDAQIKILEDLGKHSAALVKTGEPLRRRRVVGWTDLFGGSQCSINAYRARANGEDGILICGGNSGLRILANASDPDVRGEFDAHLPNGWGRPVMWIGDESDFIKFEDEASAAAALLGSRTSERKAAAVRENGKLGGRPKKTK